MKEIPFVPGDRGLIEAAKRAMSAQVPARPVGDPEYPRQPRQRAQSRREVEPVFDPILCPACGGETFLLGVLGRRLHARCRYCGLDTNTIMEV